MFGFAEPQSVYFRRGLFLLHVWPTAHWYSRHTHSINTRDQSQARVVFNELRGFTAAALYSYCLYKRTGFSQVVFFANLFSKSHSPDQRPLLGPAAE